MPEKEATTEVSVAPKVWKPTPKEMEFLTAISKPDVTIDVVIPEQISYKDWGFQTGVVCKVLDRAERQTKTMLVTLGRLILVAQTSNQLIKDAGYEDFDTFKAEKIDPLVSRTTYYDAVKLARFSDAITIGDYEEIGRRSLMVLNKAIPEGQEDKAFAKKLYEKAKTTTESELKTFCEEKGYIEPGEVAGSVIKIPANKSEAKRWNEFKDDARVQAKVGNGKESKILMAMIEEVSAEWFAEGEAKLEEVPLESVEV